MSSNLALFDFDHTITVNDNFASFVHYAVPRYRVVTGSTVLSPLIAAYKLGLFPAAKMRAAIAIAGFAGFTLERLQQLGSKYARDCLPKYVRKKALERMQWHKAQGDKVVVVSASLEVYLFDWCKVMGVDLIATQMQVFRGRITGRYLHGDCSGEEKARRIRERYDLQSYTGIYAYGDSAEDKAMLALAHRRFYRWEEG